jgi:hypothetical protein
VKTVCKDPVTGNDFLLDVQLTYQDLDRSVDLFRKRIQEIETEKQRLAEPQEHKP